MHKYLAILNHIMEHGSTTPCRQGGFTKSVFGVQFRHKMSRGFPLLTTKHVNFDTVKKELAGFLAGALYAKDMYGIKIWDDDAARWAKERGAKDDGYLGRIYGVQWRHWDCRIDQLRKVVNGIKENPFSRRHLVTAWHPSELDAMCLPPCHYAFQFKVWPDEGLDIIFIMRSVDMFLGFPFDLASYALLLHIVAYETGLVPNRVIAQLGDAHIYEEHFKYVEQQLARDPYELPFIDLEPYATIDNFTPEMVAVRHYKYWPAIKAPLIT